MEGLARLQKLDRRWIYLILVVLISWPLFKPIGLPLRVSPMVKESYEFVESLPPGSVVVWSVDSGVAVYGEQFPQARVTLEHLAKKPGLKIIIVHFWEQGPLFFNALSSLLEKSGKKYGEDWVDLGYIPGGEPAMAAFADDIYKTVPTDVRGTPVETLPLMKQVKNAKDIKLWITISAGTPGIPEYARQIQSRYKVPFIAGVLSQFATIYMPYMNSKQLVGMLGGLRAAAEYEKLLGTSGIAVKAVDALSNAHLVIIAFVLLANIVYLAQRSQLGER
ncbi:MAG: hypothetical protein M1553_01230 [Firmicutes bacterium]|nr:hypothetical protein [Bacillota bacterium]